MSTPPTLLMAHLRSRRGLGAERWRGNGRIFTNCSQPVAVINHTHTHTHRQTEFYVNQPTRPTDSLLAKHVSPCYRHYRPTGCSSREWFGSRVVRVWNSGAEGPGFKSQSRRCRVTVLGNLFTPIVPLFTKQRNWQQPS